MKTIQKEEEVWFQLDYLRNLREFLASAYEVKGSDAVLYDDEENMLKKVVMMSGSKSRVWVPLLGFGSSSGYNLQVFIRYNYPQVTLGCYSESIAL